MVDKNTWKKSHEIQGRWAWKGIYFSVRDECLLKLQNLNFKKCRSHCSFLLLDPGHEVWCLDPLTGNTGPKWRSMTLSLPGLTSPRPSLPRCVYVCVHRVCIWVCAVWLREKMGIEIAWRVLLQHLIANLCLYAFVSCVCVCVISDESPSGTDSAVNAWFSRGSPTLCTFMIESENKEDFMEDFCSVFLNFFCFWFCLFLHPSITTSKTFFPKWETVAVFLTELQILAGKLKSVWICCVLDLYHDMRIGFLSPNMNMFKCDLTRNCIMMKWCSFLKLLP